MASTLEPLVLLEDEPVRDHSTDELSVLDFSRVVAGAALGTSGPFTIGIYGDWGHGKTSVLKQARGLLDSAAGDKVVTVLFNAWQFEHEEHPIVPLVATIVQAIDNKLAEWQTLGSKIAEKTVGALKSISRAMRAMAYGFSAKTKVGIPGFADVEAGFVAKEMIERYDKLASPQDPLLGRTLYYNAFEALDKAAGTYGKDKGEEPPHKIVVLIDDLDRCLPPQALKLIEGIKIVLAQRGFIFVLAVDERILRGYLTHRYREEFHVADYEIGPSYLDKIVQLPLALPSHRSRFEDYIRGLLKRPAMTNAANRPVRDAIDELVEVLAVGSNHNPRALVRFINNLIVDRSLWAAKKTETNAELLGLCAVSRILRQHLSDASYALLAGSDEICKAILEEKTKELMPGPEHEVSRANSRRRTLLNQFEEKSFLHELLKSKPGRQWLSDSMFRRKIDEYLAERDENEEPQNDSIVDHAIRGALRLDPYVSISSLHRKQVEHLDFSVTRITDKDLAELRVLTKLQGLDLSGTQITDKGIAELKDLAALQKLHLSGTEITSKGIANLKGLTALRELYLSDTQITDKGVGELKWLTTLQVLYLSRTQVTDKGIAELKGLTALRELYLSDTQITDKGVAALKELTALRGLYLSGTQVTDKGVAELKGLTTLRVLYLSRTQVTDSGINALNAANPKLSIRPR